MTEIQNRDGQSSGSGDGNTATKVAAKCPRSASSANSKSRRQTVTSSLLTFASRVQGDFQFIQDLYNHWRSHLPTIATHLPMHHPSMSIAQATRECSQLIGSSRILISIHQPGFVFESNICFKAFSMTPANAASLRPLSPSASCSVHHHRPLRLRHWLEMPTIHQV